MREKARASAAVAGALSVERKCRMDEALHCTALQRTAAKVTYTALH